MSLKKTYKHNLLIFFLKFPSSFFPFNFIFYFFPHILPQNFHESHIILYFNENAIIFQDYLKGFHPNLIFIGVVECKQVCTFYQIN